MLLLFFFGQSGLTWLLMDERRCDVISMVDASDCRGGVAVSMCSLEAVAVETESLMSKSQTALRISSPTCLCVYVCVCVSLQVHVLSET